MATVTVGRVPIPFGGLASYGRARGRSHGRAPTFRGFAGSADLVSLANQALIRLQSAIDTANEACSSKSSLDFWTGASTLNWILGNNTSTQSICAAAQQMQIDYDSYSAKVADPNTTDDELGEILAAINKNVDIRDLLETAKATGGAAALELALKAPGAAVGAAGEGLGKIIEGILKNIPWWGWAIAAVVVANQLGWKPLRKKG
jgi:hypothetical protein